MSQAAYDVIIVGAGPAGLSAAARAQHYNLNYLVLEQHNLANTIEEQYQDGKYVMALPAVIPLRSGDLAFAAGSREAVLATWAQYAAEKHLNISTGTSVAAITKASDYFKVKAKKDQQEECYTAKHVVLAIGKLGNPRKLNVPGEEFPHVSYLLRNPNVFAGEDILVVGAGDSAAEVVLALSVRNRVAISYRKGEFSSMNSASLRSQIEQKMQSQEITVYFESEVERIEPGLATLKFRDKRQMRIKADHVFVKIGAEIPRPFLESCGVTFPSDHIAALPEINERYETKVPGLFLIGAVGGKELIKHALNQGYEVIEHILGQAVEPVDEPLLRERLRCVLTLDDSVDAKLTYIASTVPLLAQIPRLLLRELAVVSSVHSVERGHIIFREGDFSTSFYTIVDGRVEISFKADAHRKITGHKGEFFGEMALIADRRRSATITASDPSILLEIPRRIVLKLIQAEPSVQRLIDEAYVLRVLQTYLGPDLATEAFEEVAKKAELKTFQKDEVILRAGDPGDGFYLIRSGSVKISKGSTEGKEYVITYLPAGAYFGEIALLASIRGTRVATASAATRTEVIRILKDDFLAFLTKHPHLEAQLRALATQRDLEAAMILAAPKTQVLADFIAHGVIESTDVLLIDETKCIRCDNCVTACAATHNGQTRLERVSGPSFAHIHVPVSCRHCEGAPCIQHCEAGDAIERDPNGVVQVYEDKCIGCGNCARDCPYGAISMVETPKKPTFWDRFPLLGQLCGRKSSTAAAGAHQEVAIKCDLCTSINVKKDMVDPACVQSCPTGAAIRVRPNYFKEVEFR